MKKKTAPYCSSGASEKFSKKTLFFELLQTAPVENRKLFPFLFALLHTAPVVQRKTFLFLLRCRPDRSMPKKRTPGAKSGNFHARNRLLLQLLHTAPYPIYKRNY